MSFVPVPIAIGGWRHFIKDCDEARGDVLQEVFRVRPGENLGVLPQLVGELVDDEGRGGLWREGIESLLQQRPLLVDLHGAEWDARDDVIAMLDAADFEFVGDLVRSGIDDMDAGVVAKLAPEVAGQLGVEFEHQEGGVPVHLARDLAGVTALPRAVFHDYPRLGKIELAGDPADQLLGTRDDGSDLQRTGQEPLEK